MRIGFLSSVSLALGAVCATPAYASFDESICEVLWTPQGSGACNSVPFLSPNNDSRTNLRLLMSDQGTLPLSPLALSNNDLQAGYGPVPFDLMRLDPEPESATPAAQDAVLARLDQQLAQLELPAVATLDQRPHFIEGEGNRCRSNNLESASAFIGQLLDTPELSTQERSELAGERMQMLQVCEWEAGNAEVLIEDQHFSATGKAFADYLRGAAEFYSGRFDKATQRFASLTDSPQPWLKETALYMSARIPLNAAQADTFDDMGLPDLNKVDRPNLQLAEQNLERYLAAYPQGHFSASAKGLLRRVHWLSGDDRKLAEDYSWQLLHATPAQRNISLPELIQETDNKLLGTEAPDIRTPQLLAVEDLSRIGAYQGTFNLKQLQAQKAVFAEQPALFDYLQAAAYLNLEDKPQQALALLPGSVPAQLDYFAFSQQVLRGLALHKTQDWKAAEALWLELLGKVKQPLQRDYVELALAWNYEFSQRLDNVFAADSPIKTPQLRYRLQRLSADLPLLRQQVTQGVDAGERDSALFVLLYKELLRGQYAAFAEDFKRMPASPSPDKLGVGIGYFYDSGKPLAMFNWQGEPGESGYGCPSIAEIAAVLQANNRQPKGLNCLGEFILRNGLDHSPLDAAPYKGELGSSGIDAKQAVFSRHEGYRQVIDNQHAPKDDRAYALFRAIKCYAPSGNNSCGGSDVEPAVRKAWFRQIKGTYADTQWSKSLPYYW